MRFNHRSITHWLVVAAIAIVALFTFSPARGHSANGGAIAAAGSAGN